MRTRQWSASSPLDDAPTAPLRHLSHLIVLWLEVTHRAAKSSFGLAEHFHGLCLVFPENQVYPERSPVWKLLLESPPHACPVLAPSREAGRVSPSSPICGHGGGRSMSKAKRLGELWRLLHFVTPVHPNVGLHPRPRRTLAAHVSGLPVAPQWLPASFQRLVSLGLGSLWCQVRGSLRGACALTPRSTPQSPRPRSPRHCSLNVISSPFSCVQKLGVEFVLRA